MALRTGGERAGPLRVADQRISGASADVQSESDIRLNYGDPSKIIGGANDITSGLQSQFYSADGGANWGRTAGGLALQGSDTFQSDPAVDWTSDGTAWALTLGVDAFMNIQMRCYKSSDGGKTWAFDSTPTGTQIAVDRETFWVDHSPTSPTKDQMYVMYHNGFPAFVATRPAGGAWQAPVQVSGAETTGLAIGGDIKTNAFGDVFAFWPDNSGGGKTGSGKIYVSKFPVGGANFGAPVSIGPVRAGNFDWFIPADASRGISCYVSAGTYRTPTKDLVYALWTDLSGAAGCTSGTGPGSDTTSTCKSRIWFARSTNGGANWSAPVKINDQVGKNDQFHARLCVDEATGNLMATYYDTVSDAGRLKTDVWMQVSTDDGQNWSTAQRVTSAQTDETAASADSGNQYGDYIGLSGFYGNFWACWTDRRGGASEEIWAEHMPLVAKQCSFVVDKSTFGQDEVQAMLTSGSATVNAAFYVLVDGFSAAALGIVAADLAGPPTHKPALNAAPAFAGMVIGQPTVLLAEDPALPATPQRFTWVYPVSFTDTTGFTQAVTTMTLTAAISSVSASAQLQLLQQPDPYELDGATSWLSTDLRVFYVKQGQTKFGATLGGSTPADAIAFIQQVLTNLNPGGNSGGQTFDTDLDPSGTGVALNPTDAGGTAIFNFAIAKVRYRGVAQDAQAVRVFFRLCPALTVSTAYDPTTTYRTYSDGVQYGQKIALLGTQNANILTIPCFASPRVSPGASMTTQTDAPNVQPILHDASGAEVVHYFGCWLDINQGAQKWFPLNPTGDGPFGGTLKSVLELVRNAHQCLLSEIAFDPDPIPTTPAPVTPGTSDKLAQRNLTLLPSANPGDQASRRIPNTFELKPTPAERAQTPDELMIVWGNVPTGAAARVYLPTVRADDVIELAARRGSAAHLRRLDDHTVGCEAAQVTYIPIPLGPSLNHTGLLTVDLPAGVRKGQKFHALVRQISMRTESAQKPDVQSGGADRGNVEGANAAVLAVRAERRAWWQVRGTFEVAIPVQTAPEMRGPAEELYSIARWILGSIPKQDRWHPSFERYVRELGERVRALGGDPANIPPTPDGHWDHEAILPRGGGEGRIEFSGKVSALVYDRFGDFEGFILETEDGQRRFRSREPEVEDLAYEAWRERFGISVVVERHALAQPESIVLREPTRRADR